MSEILKKILKKFLTCSWSPAGHKTELTCWLQNIMWKKKQKATFQKKRNEYEKTKDNLPPKQNVDEKTKDNLPPKQNVAEKNKSQPPTKTE